MQPLYKKLVFVFALFSSSLAFAGDDLNDRNQEIVARHANDVAQTKSLLSWIDQKRYQQTVEHLSGAALLPTSGIQLSDRYTTENLQAVRQYIRESLRDAGFTRIYTDNFNLEGRKTQGKNFWVDIKGKSSSEIIVVGAHYDSTQPNRPGADDNASGTAAVLEIARAFKEAKIQPERTIRFMIFDAEENHRQFEIGETGSEYSLGKAVLEGAKIELFLNMDMIAYSPQGYKHVMFDPGKYLNILSVVRAANDNGKLGFKLENWGTHRSDQQSGWALGIPSVSIFESPRSVKGRVLVDFPYYHQKTDTVDKLNFEYATEVVKLVGGMALHASKVNHWSSKTAQQRPLTNAEYRKSLKDRSQLIEKRTQELVNQQKKDGKRGSLESRSFKKRRVFK